MELEKNDVRVQFVLQGKESEVTCSESKQEAFSQCSEFGFNPVWIKDKSCLSMTPSKTDIFIFDNFEGEAYDYLVSSNFKCTILGPKCLLACLLNNEPIPELPYPMLTASMKGLVITSTGFDKEQKERLKLMIERMSGIYSNNFHDGVTHLVVEVVHSRKHQVAAQKEVPVMTLQWVEEVWKEGKEKIVHATDSKFIEYKCPVFKGLNICLSQLNKKEKELIRKVIESNGGIYEPQLILERANVLIIPKPEGEKFLWAKKWKIPCLSCEWIFDSIEKGYTQESQNYTVDKTAENKCSTPTKSRSMLKSVNLDDVSMCSTIVNPNDTLVTSRVNETVKGDISTFEPPNNKHTLWLQELDLNAVKSAGPFLDGITIFLSGFDAIEQDKLRRLLKLSGALRLNELDESVTHVISAKMVQQHQNIMKNFASKPYQVTLEWVIDSMKTKHPVNETEYLCSHISHELIDENLLRRDVGKTIVSHKSINVSHNEIDVLNLYGNNTMKEGNFHHENTEETTMANEETNYDEMTQFPQIFKELTFDVVGFNEELCQNVTEFITSAGGEVVYSDHVSIVDYLVTPAVSNEKGKLSYRESVNYYWLEDCLDKEELVAIQYYHRPVSIDESVKPLDGVVIGISSYVGFERSYLQDIATKLGVIAQDVFVRKDNSRKEAKRSTHLICPVAEGQKYEAAIKWGLPVVNKDWILASLDEMTYISEKPFLVGKSTVFNEDKLLPQAKKPSVDEPITPVDDANKKNSAKKLQTPQIQKLISKMPYLDTSNEVTPGKLQFLESQPSPSTKRKREVEEVFKDIYPATIKTPDTPYGAFAYGSNVTPKTRKLFKKNFADILERKRLINESEQSAKVRKISNNENIGKGEASKEETDEKIINALNNIHTEKHHSKVIEQLKAKGFTFPSDTLSFDQIMENRLNKVKKTWQKPDIGNDKINFQESSTRIGETEDIEANDANILKQANTRKANIGKQCDNAMQTIKKVSEFMDSSKNLERSKSIGIKLSEISTPDKGKKLESPKKVINAESQNTEISWKDPQEQKEMDKLLATLTDNDSTLHTQENRILDSVDFESMDIPEDITQEILGKSEKQKRFMLSGFSEDEKMVFKRLLERLGGFVSEIPHFDASCTHIVSGKVTRSEKILASIASGKWLLHRSYFEELSLKNSFVPEEPFEWGHPDNKFISTLSPAEIELASAAYKWRKSVSDNFGSGAFENIVAVLHTDNNKASAFERLIVAGGGKTVNVKPPYSCLTGVTHCFAEPNKKPLSENEMKNFYSFKIPILPPGFLNTIVVSDSIENLSENYIDVYKSFIDKQ